MWLVGVIMVFLLFTILDLRGFIPSVEFFERADGPIISKLELFDFFIKILRCAPDPPDLEVDDSFLNLVSTPDILNFYLLSLKSLSLSLFPGCENWFPYYEFFYRCEWLFCALLDIEWPTFEFYPAVLLLNILFCRLNDSSSRPIYRSSFEIDWLELSIIKDALMIDFRSALGGLSHYDFLIYICLKLGTLMYTSFSGLKKLSFLTLTL